MKLLLIGLLLFSLVSHAQYNVGAEHTVNERWKLDKNKWITGGLVFLAGASKGFNETLIFHFDEFLQRFPRADPQWFDPQQSWTNKYKDGDPTHGARFPLSTSVLVMTTDQYHLDNFINKSAWVSAIMIKMGEGKKSFKYRLFDLLYYTACHQLGFALTYYPYRRDKPIH
ncbi:MAG: hypothetical protein ACHQF0_08840 [Chitinophagales bacterium]